MDEKEYFRQLPNVSPRKKNNIITAVSCRTPESEILLESEVDRMFYQRLWQEAEAHLEKHGTWPVFDLVELD